MTTLTLTCRCCGYDFAFPEDAAIFDCPACGTRHTRPKAPGAEPGVLKRAHQLRAACDFTQAEKDYRRILTEHPNEHEALWGLVLCSYGVEYVETSRSDGAKVRTPVIHFLRRKPLMEDANYRLACAAAPEEVRALYEADAQYIDGIRQGVLAKEAQAEDCDIFLCYKATGADGQGQAAEYVHAMQLYMELEKQGYRVFFAHQSLTKAIGANYEAQIYHALHKAKVMLLVCADPANLNTPWVRSEWSRFLERVDAGEQCKLIPLLYDGCDPYALPGEMIARGLQGLRMGELTSLDALKRRLEDIFGKLPPLPQPSIILRIIRGFRTTVTQICRKAKAGTAVCFSRVKDAFKKKNKPKPPKAKKASVKKPVSAETLAKRKRRKKVLLASAAVLAALICLVLATTYSHYEIEINLDGTCTIKSWYGYAWDVDIPSTIKGHRVTAIGDYAFSQMENTALMILGDLGIQIRSVRIPNGVTTIGEGAFELNTELDHVVLPDSLTTIEKDAFADCGFWTLSIPDSVTTIGEGAFSGCYKLWQVRLPKNLTAIANYTFGMCSNLWDIELPDCLTTIGNIAFAACYALEDLVIPRSVTVISENAFNLCKKLTLGVYRNSYAATYARQNDLAYEYVD